MMAPPMKATAAMIQSRWVMLRMKSMLAPLLLFVRAGVAPARPLRL